MFEKYLVTINSAYSVEFYEHLAWWQGIMSHYTQVGELVGQIMHLPACHYQQVKSYKQEIIDTLFDKFN